MLRKQNPKHNPKGDCLDPVLQGSLPQMKPILLDLPMPIQTPRLILRPSEAGRGRALNEAVLESLAELQPWMNWAQKPPTIEESEENCRRSQASFLLREDLVMQIFERATGRLLGGTGWHRFSWEARVFEIGYWIRTSAAGKGYVTEAVHALTRYGFSVLGARRIEIRVNSGNLRSQKIPRALGFQEEACLKNGERFAPISTKTRDLHMFARTDLTGLPELEVTWPESAAH